MSNKNLIIFIMLFLSAISAAPAVLLAEDGLEGNVEAGGAYVDDLDSKSFKYGEYTGVYKDGAYLAGNADLSYNRDAFFLDFRGNDIGLNTKRSNSFYLDTGRYGMYKLFLGYDELPKLISNNSKTPLMGAGSATLTLPAGFVRGSATSNLTNLSSNKKDVELSTRRKDESAGFSMNMDKLDFNISFKKDEKKGIKSIGGTLGNSGGNTRSIVLPEPVDYTTDELRASLAYTDSAAQIQFDYYLSDFSNANKYITWDNPFNVADYPTTARTSLPPDNQHQKFSLSGGMNLPFAATRVSAIAEYGIMQQDETLLPYSNNPNTTLTSQLPRGTADTEIDVTNLGLNISSRPMSGLELSAKYKYYKTDNKIPRTLFLYVKNDMGGASQATATSDYALYSLPYDYTQNQLKLDASYYLFSGATLKIGYDHDIIDRDYREIKTTVENTYRARLNSNLFSFAAAGIDFTYGQRRGDQYEESAMYDAYRSQTYIDTVTANVRFDNLPAMRKFDIADRDRTRYGANLTLFPATNTTVGLYYNYLQDDYEATTFGLLKNENKSYTIDATYSPVDSVSTYTYYTMENLKAEQGSRAYSGGATKYTQSTDPNRNWWAENDQNINTLGLGVNFGFMENKLTLGADYSYSESTGAIKFITGSSITATNMPDLKTELQTLKASAKYKLTKNTTLGLGYKYESYKSANWSTDNIDPASTAIANVLTLSGSVPDYQAHQAMLTIAYNF